MFSPLILRFGLGVSAFFIAFSCQATGVYRDGLSAQSSSLAGINTVAADSPLAIMTGNPAGLANLDQSVTELNLSLADFDARYANSLDSDRSSIDRGLIPAAALVSSQGERLSWGLSVTPDVALQTRYMLQDPPGGLADVSYGTRVHESTMLAVRLAANLGWQVSDRLSIGGSLGATWNRNELKAPYIFQSQAPSILPGFKTLLDLESDGWGVTAQFGISYLPVNGVELGISYRPETRIVSQGRASGDAAAQLLQLGVTGFQSDFDYDVEIKTRIPSLASLGVGWQLSSDWLLVAQFDQIGSGKYDNLRLDLSSGNNANLNGLVGDDSFREVIPLGWDDQQVFRLGVSYNWNADWTLRAGAARAANPIPPGTLTPLTGAIAENIYSFGGSRVLAGGRLDISYQYVGGGSERVENSVLLGGEYSNSRFELGGHWINLGWHF